MQPQRARPVGPTHSSLATEIGADHFSVVVSREDVEKRETGRVLNVLSSLTVSARVMRQFCGRVDLFFGGYDDDPREVFEIPEVRAFVRDLDARFPELPYLLSRHTRIHRTFAFCLVPAEMSDDGRVRVDRSEYHALVARWLGQTSRLARQTHDDLDEREELAVDLERCLLT